MENNYAKEFARKGGKARWEGISKEERSQIMSEIAKRPRKDKAQKLSPDYL